MGQAPDEIRQQIEQTRERMTETVEALGYKTDVKGRAADYGRRKRNGVARAFTAAKEAIVGTGDSAIGGVAGGASGARDSMTGAAAGARDAVASALPSSEQLRHGADAARERATRAVGVAQENPVGLLVGGIAIGFLAGLLGPTTRMEDDRLGPMADQVKDAIRETGGEALERGKQVVRDVGSAAADTARETAQQHSHEFAASVQETTQTLASGS